jgi:hypothetical protein
VALDSSGNEKLLAAEILRPSANNAEPRKKKNAKGRERERERCGTHKTEGFTLEKEWPPKRQIALKERQEVSSTTQQEV